MGESKLSVRNPAWRILLVLAFVAAALILYYKFGLSLSPERFREAGVGGWVAAGVIILAMAVAWAFALPASAFFFVTPLLFPPHLSALITTTGCAMGTAAGYAVARYVGGPWVERLREGRLVRFISRHSSFLVLFGMRLAPGGPHGFINYAAGLAAIPFARFVGATTMALAIKSYVYALAVHNTVGARSLGDALSARTVLSLLALALLALTGHVIRQRYLRVEEEVETSARG